jgi:hypothetical protein
MASQSGCKRNTITLKEKNGDDLNVGGRYTYLRHFTSFPFTMVNGGHHIITLSEAGIRTCEIAKKLKLPWTTVDTILRGKMKYKAKAGVESRLVSY